MDEMYALLPKCDEMQRVVMKTFSRSAHEVNSCFVMLSRCVLMFHLRGGNYFSGSSTGVKTTIAKQPEMSSEDVVE